MVKENYLTVPQLAKLLGVSRIAVYKMVKKGRIKAEKIGRSYVILDRDITHILGGELPDSQKKWIDNAVNLTIRDYGELLRKLGEQ